MFQEWTAGVDVIAKSNLEKPLLVREVKDELELIQVNFDPQVSSVIIIQLMYEVVMRFNVIHYSLWRCYVKSSISTKEKRGQTSQSQKVQLTCLKRTRLIVNSFKI